MPYKICRLCLYKTNINHSLLENNASKMLEALTSIKVLPTDEVLTICFKCSLNLKLAYKIQQNFLKAQESLKRSYFNFGTNNEKNPVVIKAKETENDNVGEDENLDSVCLICNSVLGEKSEVSHVQQHFNDEQFCDLCDKIFKNINSYQQHLSQHPQNEKYRCHKCKFTFRYRSLYNIHKEKAHLDNVIVVEIVDDHHSNTKERIRPLININEQIKTMYQKGISNDRVIPEVEKIVKKRTTKADPNNPYICEICSKKFVDKEVFRRHKNNHKRKTCPVCNKSITIANFSKHVDNHSVVPHVCEHCGKTYSSSEKLRGHVIYQHSGKIYECRKCERTFKSRQALNIHKKRAHPEEEHICERCGKKFVLIGALKIHIRHTHLNEKPYVCEFCNRAFSGREAMKTHRRIHTNETPYRCDVCGEGFRQRVSLRTHQKSKHGIVEVITCQCHVCGKGFASTHAVKSHMRLH